MKIRFATSNLGKLQEARHTLEPLGFTVEDLGVKLTEVQGTQEEVARHKVFEARKHTSETVLVEDSGFYIDCFSDFPGVYARPVMAGIGHAGMLKLVAGTNRKAHFRSIIAYLSSNSTTPLLFNGECSGKISESETKLIHPELPYDSIFIPEGDSRTFGEMGLSEKVKFDHRAKAFRALAQHLRENK